MWSRFDDNFHDNAKILSLSHPAFRLYVTSVTFSTRRRSRGFLTREQARALARQQGIQTAAIRELVTKHAWHDEEDGFQIHDYDEYHPKDPTGADRVARHRERQKKAPEPPSRPLRDRYKTVTEPLQDRNPNVTLSGVPEPEPEPDPIREGSGYRDTFLSSTRGEGFEPVAPYARAPGAPAEKPRARAAGLLTRAEQEERRQFLKRQAEELERKETG